eukprot:CAMPEP_0202048874 /NCGR_PEP_ID=MMETSP0963-20130614/3014_1 /ASSEMBLY_ACC=CAM_ASM_000494 /TAXON_ID=4773 /ORGANISM="Schizochytrium aggregatum, Strain ATCC28209" /LENGTH=108 /DNA_ID=CAMNT_0048613837 /DNA_START=952 /DNA_END=1276 /DNA_ORIENTATION=-
MTSTDEPEHGEDGHQGDGAAGVAQEERQAVELVNAVEYSGEREHAEGEEGLDEVPERAPHAGGIVRAQRHGQQAGRHEEHREELPPGARGQAGEHQQAGAERRASGEP